MIIAGRVIFGLLAAASLLKLLVARVPAAALGHIVALWAICWLAAKLAERGALWLVPGLAGFAFGWVLVPILPVIVLYVLERITRPKLVRGGALNRGGAGARRPVAPRVQGLPHKSPARN